MAAMIALAHYHSRAATTVVSWEAGSPDARGKPADIGCVSSWIAEAGGIAAPTPAATRPRAVAPEFANDIAKGQRQRTARDAEGGRMQVIERTPHATKREAW